MNNAYQRRPRIADTFTTASPRSEASQKKVNTSIWIPVELQREIRIAAAQRDMRLSEFIEYAVRRELDQPR